MNIAQPWFDAGCSVVPIRADGTKRPGIEWAHLQREAMDQATVSKTWDNYPARGVAVICGQVSGNLEMLEIEGEYATKEILYALGVAMSEAGVANPWSDLWLGYAEETPSGGVHLLYRIGDVDVPGNTKIAQDVNGKTKAETRGEGGYVIVAPTGGRCHPTDRPWKAINNTIPATIPVITWAQRNTIHGVIRQLLDESAPPPPPPGPRVPAVNQGERPGDLFNERASWADILTDWTVVERRGQETLWARPGKSPREGHSASTGYANDQDRLYVWSTSAGLPTDTPLSKFWVYAQLHHRGDMTVAAREVARLYDMTPTRPDQASIDDVMLGGLPSAGEVPKKSWQMWDESLTDSGNVERMRQLLGTEFRYNEATRKWLYYRDGVWRIDKGHRRVTAAVEQCLVQMYNLAKKDYDQSVAGSDDGKAEPWAIERFKHAKASLSTSRIEATVRLWRCRAEVGVDNCDLNAQTDLLNLENSVLHTKTFELVPHNPEFLFTKKMGAGYVKGATAPTWSRYLDQVLPDKDTQDYVQRLVGYTMCGTPNERVVAVLHGPGGTGKSRFIETLNSVFGDYGVTAAASLFRSKFSESGPTNDLNDLRGARLASMSELDSGVAMDEALVKRLSGFDKITSRGLYEENDSWMPECVIWLATNHHFRVASDDGAIWHRLKIIPFDQEISDRDRDPDLLSKLMAERHGIFNWMLEGLRKYRERGLRDPGEQITGAVNSYRDEQDVVRRFFTDAFSSGMLVKASENETIGMTNLHAMYMEWSRSEQDRYPLGRTRFNRRLRAMGLKEHKASIMRWKGIKLGTAGALGTM